MSTNFNLAMLRNLHDPVSESLDAAIVQLSQYAAGTMDPSSFSGAHHAHLVNGSLSVIGCRAAAKVAALLEAAMVALPVPQTRGWSIDHAIEVARLCQGLATQLLEHINRILSDMEDLPVRMWPAYRDLHQHLASSVPATPEDLYEPDPNFQNLKFAPLAEDYLSSVVRGAISRLREAIEKVEASTGKQDLESGLQSSLKVFDWVYSLRHARGYQAYWLALSARVSTGLLDQDVLGDKGPWSVLLGEALIELEKFSRNNRRVDPELLGKTIRPLVSRWPAHWVQSHPTLAETNERLGISFFWDTLDHVESSQMPEMVRPSNEMPAIVEQLKLAWGRYVVAEGAYPDQVLSQAMETFRKAYPEAVLDQAGAGALMNTLVSSLENLPSPGEVSDTISVEFAAAVLLLEDALEGRGRQASIADSQSALQRRRLHASLTGDTDQLGSLPRLRWDDKKHDRQVRAAASAAFAQVQKDIAEIEESLVERLRDDHVSLDMAALSRRANQAAQVLEMLDAKPAATIANSLVALVERVDRNPGKDLGHAVTLGIAALDTFLSARQAGDGEATHLLAEAYETITGEPMPYGYATEVDTDEVKRAAQDLISKSSKAESDEDILEFPISEMGEPEPAHTPAAPSYRSELPRFDPALLVEGCRVARAGQPTEAFFLEEMDHVLAEIAMQRGVLSSDPSDSEARQTLRRQFHTIKGSSRIAGFDAIGHASERVEKYLDHALISRAQHLHVDDTVVSRVVVDMKQWFSALSGNHEALVTAAVIDAWFDGVDESETSVEEESNQIVDEPVDEIVDAVPADVVLDDVEIVAIAGYGSMEYEAYYCMTEDLQKSLGILDDLASASPEDSLSMEDVEGSLRGVMDIGESMGAPALARLPRAMLENAQASMSRTGLSSTRVFATDALSTAARELGSVIRSLSDDRKMAAVAAELLHSLQSNTDFLRADASVQGDAEATVMTQSDHEDVQVANADIDHSIQPAPSFMDDLTRGLEDEDVGESSTMPESVSRDIDTVDLPAEPQVSNDDVADTSVSDDAEPAADIAAAPAAVDRADATSNYGSDLDEVAPPVLAADPNEFDLGTDESRDVVVSGEAALMDALAVEATDVVPAPTDAPTDVVVSGEAALIDALAVEATDVVLAPTDAPPDVVVSGEAALMDALAVEATDVVLAQPSESTGDEYLSIDVAPEPAVELVQKADGDDVTVAPGESVVLDALAVIPEEQASTQDAEEDELWDEVFDNFEQISACLRKIGPLLVSLSERRK